MRPLIALILLACTAVGCMEESIEPVTASPFTLDLDRCVAELQDSYAALEPATRQRDNDCRRLVWSMLAMPNTAAEHQELSDRLASLLAANDEFRMHDGHIMLLGSQAMAEHPPTDRAFLMAMAGKVNRARRPDTPEAYRTSFSSLAVGIIVDSVEYPDRVDTYDDEVNYAQWDILHGWLETNMPNMHLDEQTKRYRLPTTAQPRNRPSPTMDDPGR